MSMNTKLNALIAAEIGVDDGSFLPLKDCIDWDKAGRPASISKWRAAHPACALRL